MQVTGEMLIGSRSVRGKTAVLHALDPQQNTTAEPAFGGGGQEEVNRATRLAEDAFGSYSRTTPEQRADFLNAIADGLMSLGDVLVDRVMLETGLPRGRVEGEQGRTAQQLRMFADVVRGGHWRGVRIDSSDHARKPLPKPDVRLQKVALGPVAVFGSSNFPLLYSVAGGDTASALAAGCPVVVKAHFSHLGTSELVGRVIQKAVADAGFHEGVFSLLIGEGNAIGEALVDHPLIQAVGFTGSEGGGMALVKRGQQRPQPIPVFAEMTSVNPNIIMPDALKARAREIATQFVDQMALGVGQMCLKPGMIIAVDGDGYDELRQALSSAVVTKPAATMLNPGILSNFERGVKKHVESDYVKTVGTGAGPKAPLDGRSAVFEISAADLLANMALADEMFGPAAVLVRCKDIAEIRTLLTQLHGQLTIAFHADAGDVAAAKELIPFAERKSGRILINRFSNMVEIGSASFHGGPFPATSDPRFTSVGSTAIDRFLRPISYEGFFPELLPPALQDANPFSLWRIRDGVPSNA